MNSTIETGVIIAAVALAAVFVVLRVVKTFRSKRPSCCSGGDKGACPHCEKK
ncbi:FeoB-associated Cys-rich membrane protein [Treponema primitia]|uniref:hypothetical protein n=1 Tax=Treponema primitia TaxID=88058 RepID=UPI0039817BC5